MSREPIDHYPLVKARAIADDLTRVKQQIVMELFNAIQREDAQAIVLLIQLNLVTANTTSKFGQTPLLEAISTKSIAIVKEVLDLGADCNKFSVPVSSETADPSIANASPDSCLTPWVKQHAPH
jgi:ankyrin repeat protein